MNRLPAYQSAVIPRDKLRYCLDLSHPTGGHKARVFASALGIELADAPILERMLRQGIASNEACLRFTLVDGTERWVVEWTVLGRLGPIRLISVWNVPRRIRHPQLVTCYLKWVKT